MEIESPTVLLDGLRFPESPRWHDNWLWFSDILAHAVYAVDTGGECELVLTVDDRPSGLGFLPDGSLLVCGMAKKRLLRKGPEGVRVHADLSGLEIEHINDMVVDAQGRAYVGARRRDDPRKEPDDLVVLVTPDGGVRVAASGMHRPNGAVITPDGKTLIVAETRREALTAFDIATDGSLENPRTFASTPSGRGPDGVCLDAEGAVWIGAPRGDQFLRIREGGAVTARVTVEGRRAVACMLGGSDRRTLFMLTAWRTPGVGGSITSFSSESLRSDREAPNVGLIETLQVDVPGAGYP